MAISAVLGGARHEAGRPGTTSVLRPRPAIVVYGPRGLDDTVTIGAPVGYEATGSLATLRIPDRTVQERANDVRLWPGDFSHPIVRVGDALVWADGTHAWSIRPNLVLDPIVIGDATFLVPARDDDHVWLVDRDSGRATEVGAAGEPRTSIALPPSTSPIAGVDAGLLVSGVRGTLLLDDRSGAVTRTFWNVDVRAAAGRRALTAAGSIIDLATGESVRIDRATGAPPLDPVAASFSPDGRRLAFVTGAPGTMAAGILVVDASDGSTVGFHRIGGLGNVVGSQLAWSPSGDALYFLAGDGGDAADRVIGIPIGGSAQTVALLDRAGWYWLAVS